MENFLETYREKIDDAINASLPNEDYYPPTIHQAMRYSILGTGKRIRGILALLSAELFTVEEKAVLPLAAAIECAHTYSLIHDDLPAMDDDDYRRGKLSNHRVYGEAVAILAGDALLTLAFQLVAELKVEPAKTVNILRKFSLALGSLGMVGGQTVDIESEGNEIIDIPTLQYIHTHKTGALINFSVTSGALLADKVTSEQIKALHVYGERLGLAFQIVDDILDLTGKTEELGKKSGQDKLLKKATYISHYGLEESRRQVKELISEAKGALKVFPQGSEKLRWLADYFGQRTN